MKKIITVLIFVLFAGNFFAQTDMDNIFKDTPEVIFKFKITEKNELADLTRIISIDKIQDNEVTAYANRQEFERFLAKKIPYEIVERPHLSPEEANMKTFEQIRNAKANTWDYYPTYEAYIAMMQQFATDYPELCAIEEIGTTVQNRKLLAVRISKNVHTREAEPQYFWSSTMHGDETTGYIVLLRFIDYLLSNYGSNARITNILDKMEIYICPNANPDGTYYGGNSTVSNARRYNKNGVDLNRNYKDFRDGDHPDGASWQPETVAFMNWQGTKNLTMSCNIHGGTEVCNYPWDDYATNSSGSQYTVDKNWWIRICKQYADTAMYWSNYYGFSGSPKYMKCDFSSGYTNGLDWYVVNGSRQDYTNYYNRAREWTLEISRVKLLNASQLPAHWNYNINAMLNETEEALYGLQGTVIDSTTREPLAANIMISSLDQNHSDVNSTPVNGYYARPISAGTYSVTFSAAEHITRVVSMTAVDKQTTYKDVALLSYMAVNIADEMTDNFKVYPTIVNRGNFLHLIGKNNIESVEIYNVNGQMVMRFPVHNTQCQIETSSLGSGMYILKTGEKNIKFEVK